MAGGRGSVHMFVAHARTHAHTWSFAVSRGEESETADDNYRAEVTRRAARRSAARCETDI